MSITVDLDYSRSSSRYSTARTALQNIENVIGGDGNDYFIASSNDVANSFNGGGGKDTLSYVYVGAKKIVNMLVLR